MGLLRSISWRKTSRRKCSAQPRRRRPCHDLAAGPFNSTFSNYVKGVRILGIDPGLKITGYGVIDCRSIQPALVAGGVIRLNARASLSDRLVELESELEELFDE